VIYVVLVVLALIFQPWNPPEIAPSRVSTARAATASWTT
jgi:hypothetical protein